MCSSSYQCLLFHSHIFLTFSTSSFSRNLFRPLLRSLYTGTLLHLLWPDSHFALSFWVSLLLHINFQLMRIQKINWSHTNVSIDIERLTALISHTQTDVRDYNRTQQFTQLQNKRERKRNDEKNEKEERTKRWLFIWNILYASIEFVYVWICTIHDAVE